MKLERSKEWWIRRADLEGDEIISAGPLARDGVPPRTEEPRVSRATTVVNLVRRAFRQFHRPPVKLP